MSEQEQERLKQRLRIAAKLIREKRYDVARDVLQDVDHPQALAMLQLIEGRRSKSTSPAPITAGMIVIGIAVFVLVMAAILGLLYAPRLIEALQPDIPDPYTFDGPLTEEELLYSHTLGYCYKFTGYGDEYCLDWADLVMAEHRPVALACIAPYLDTAMLLDEDYVAIGECLHGGGVPDPL